MMPFLPRIEQAIAEALAPLDVPDAPPLLVKAIRHAVFPGGGRFRPRLCLAVATACGDSAPELAHRAAAAIELLHCASLVHDDLPCFDGSALRRGLPSVHAAYGAPLAVLAGDALIVQAFGIFATPTRAAAERMPALLGIIARAAGAPHGIAAGQAWESEPHPDLGAYHRAKTAALFSAAAEAGACAAGYAHAPWRALGECLGEAYQVGDDLRDAVSSESVLGKPVGRDRALSRPSAVASLGVSGAVAHLRNLIERATASIPEVPAASALRAIIEAEAARFVPKELRQAA
jgi:geranylgeranyl diphosphate synthase type II